MKFASILALPLAVLSLQASDWPRFLGPNGNGQVPAGLSLNTDWQSAPPATLWTADLGSGCSSFAIAEGKAITLGNANNVDTIRCFDAATGEVIWSHSYDEPKEAKYYPGGTTATPTIDGDRVYVVSKQGKLFCFEFETGEILWEHDYKSDFDGRRQGWGWACSPLVYGDLLIIDPGAKDGSIVALNKRTQEVVWKIGSNEPGYAMPVVYQADGRDHLAVFHRKALAAYSLEPPEGPLFTYSWRTNYGVNASNPHYRDGKMFIGSGYGSGYGVIDVSDNQPELLHRDRGLELKFQTSLLVDDRIIAHFGDEKKGNDLVAMDFESGNLHWRHEMPGKFGNAIAIGETIIVFTDSGHVVAGKDRGDRFEEQANRKFLDGLCWAPPSYADGKLYLRSLQGDAICLDLTE